MFDWNHNTHYHRLLLRRLPETRDSALDIGSGLGLFSFKLSSVFKRVLSLEPDRKSIEYQKAKYVSHGNIEFVNDTFVEHDFGNQKFDFISAIASVHHMDLKTALERMKSLLKPGGRMVILGLYRDSSVADFLISSVAVLPNFVMNLLSVQKKSDDCEMVTALPQSTVREIKRVSHDVLNGCRFKRHLFWRYSIVYEKKVKGEK